MLCTLFRPSYSCSNILIRTAQICINVEKKFRILVQLEESMKVGVMVVIVSVLI